MVIMLFWKVNVLVLPPMPLGHALYEEQMDPGTLYKLCIATHSILAATTFMNQSPSFSNGVLL